MPNETAHGKPAILITHSDHAKLKRLANSLPESPVADELTLELDRARIVPDENPCDLVRLGSTLTYSTDAGASRTVKLAFPGDADISEGRISILTPIGVALLGLSAGQSMHWTGRDGRRRLLTVDCVEPVAAAGAKAS